MQEAEDDESFDNKRVNGLRYNFSSHGNAESMLTHSRIYRITLTVACR